MMCHFFNNSNILEHLNYSLFAVERFEKFHNLLITLIVKDTIEKFGLLDFFLYKNYLKMASFFL